MLNKGLNTIELIYVGDSIIPAGDERSLCFCIKNLELLCSDKRFVKEMVYKDDINLYLRFLCVSVGQKCNFRCKNCGTLAPYAPKKLHKYEWERVAKDIRTVFSAFPYIKILQIQGGEPFLYSDLDKVLDFVGSRYRKRIGRLEVATNGTIIPQDKYLEAMKRNAVSVRISAYDRNAQQKAELLEIKLKEFGISFWTYRFVTGKAVWYDCGNVNNLWESSTKAVAKRFEECKFNGCLTAENGKLYRCSRCTVAKEVYNINVSGKDFVDMEKGLFLNQRIKYYVNHPHYMEFCRVCKGTSENSLIPAAEQI